MTRFGNKSLRLLMRYGPLLFIPVFLYLAHNYISSRPTEYKVSASISLDGVQQQSVITGLKSKDIVNRVVDQIPIEASYFFSDRPRQEIYPDSSPVKVVVKGLKNSRNPVWISLRTIDDHHFELTRGDTTEFYGFGVPVSESYGTFTVVRNNKEDSVQRPVSVELLGRTRMVDIIYNDLHVNAGHKQDVVQLALVTGNPKKGADILNSLIDIYNGAVRKDSDNITRAAKMANIVQYDTVKKPEKDSRSLKARAADLAGQISSLKERERSAGATVQLRSGGIDKNQAKIYAAVESYIKRPIDQFVQVPYVDEIEDPDLNDQVNEFNETELSRRRYTTQMQVDSLNRNLMTLRSSIVEQIRAYLQSGHSESNSKLSRNYFEGQIAAKQRRLDDINKEIRAGGTPGYTVVKNRKAKTINEAPASSKLILLNKPEDNVEFIPIDSVKIYGMALVAGLLFPIGGWITRALYRSSSSRRTPQPEKLNGQISVLFPSNRKN